MTESIGSPRTREALATLLDAIGVHSTAYHLHGAHTNDAYVMDRCPQGWVVFYTERGAESAKAVHPTEAAACADLLSRVTAVEHAFFELVAGPAAQAEADRAFEAWLRARGTTCADLAPVDWKTDDVPWVSGPYWRRYFVRITTVRRLDEVH